MSAWAAWLIWLAVGLGTTVLLLWVLRQYEGAK
jgi:hypothetical protein